MSRIVGLLFSGFVVKAIGAALAISVAMSAADRFTADMGRVTEALTAR